MGASFRQYVLIAFDGMGATGKVRGVWCRTLRTSIDSRQHGHRDGRAEHASERYAGASWSSGGVKTRKWTLRAAGSFPPGLGESNPDLIIQ